MIRLALAILLLLRPASAQSDLFAEIDPAMKELAAVTRLPMKSRVERSFISKANLRKFLETRIQETVSDEELRVETLTLRLFGFIPADYDLKGSTVSLLTEQAAAFYDYRKKKMFILESAPESTQRFVLTHELAHALADQHFNLGRFIRKGSTDDAATARLAVMEGQAQWLMYEVMGAKTGQSLRKDPGLVRMMANMGESGLSQYPELTSAPVYIRESLLFPYSRGFLFNARVIEKLGNDGFREVFSRPPATTQHILHPDRYFARAEAVPVDLEPAPKGHKVLIEGTLGEFDCLVMFKQFGDADSAAARAERWRGGRFRVLEHRKTKEPLLQYTLAWENTEAAADFAALQSQRKGSRTRIEQHGDRVIVSDRMR
ncbi:MAG: hypothetical protein ACK6DY_21080 [Acidobacteriota bacterium]|jgi:hypothetical protein